MVVVVIGLCSSGRAEPQGALRLASIAPDGTGWARELRAMAREVEGATSGRVRVKLYFGGIAGDELEMGERIRRNQLDGAASGGMLCEQMSPAMRVMRVPGMFASREEAAAVLGRLKPLLDGDFATNGFTNLGETVIGPSILFTRTPVRSIEELRKGRYWVWDADKMMAGVFPILGFKTLRLPIAEAARAYEEGRHDGFVGPPTAALGFQWSAAAKYYEDLRLAYITGCVVVSNRAFDALSIDAQQALKAAAAKASARIGDASREMDRQLLGGLFRRQGLTEVPVSDAFRAEFDAAAKLARVELARAEVQQALIDRVEAMVAGYRAEHRR